MTEPALSEPGVLRNFTAPDFPAYWGQDTGGGGEPVKGAAKPGDVFPEDPAVTGQDGTNAAKLKGLGYLPANGADPAWEYITGTIRIGEWNFGWSSEDGDWIQGPG